MQPMPLNSFGFSSATMENNFP